MNSWLTYFDERQRRLIQNCRDYAEKDPAGVPGHNLMIIIGRMADLLDDKELAKPLKGAAKTED